MAALPTRSRRVAATLARTWLDLRYRRFSRRYDRLVLEKVDGVPLVVMPRVFNPVLLRTGALRVRALERLPLKAGLSVLDLGTGSGVGAVFAARRGASVVAVDINPQAVRCVRINALLNHVDERIDARLGNLFGPVAGLQFDVVLFNPPYYRGIPRDALDHAWRAQDVFERFAGGLDQMLAPGGYAVLTLSTDGDCDELLAELEAAGFGNEVVMETDLINEVVTTYAVQRPS